MQLTPSAVRMYVHGKPLRLLFRRSSTVAMTIKVAMEATEAAAHDG